MFIISYIDKKTCRIITHETSVITDTNIISVKKNNGYIMYLYEEAQKILATNIRKRYTTHKKKKSNGKYRRIDIPDEKIKKYMREVCKIFTSKYNFVFPECVGAYVKDRSIEQAVSKHTNSHSIMKFDIQDFFGNCTLEIVMDSLKQIYPFCIIDANILETIIKACMIEYDGKYRLPQGGPSSPLLSNLAMIPIDYKLANYAAVSKKISITRYADDIFFSFKFKANACTFFNVYSLVTKELKNAGFTLNNDKTQFHKTYYGNIWMLGISVGNTMKIGSKNKQYVKAMIWTFLRDTQDGNIWTIQEVQKLVGKVNHYRHIEPDFINDIIHKYEKKTNMNYNESVKNILCHK